MGSIQVVLGIDIGGTNTAFGLIDEMGKCYCRNQIPTEGHLPAEFLLNRVFSVFNLEYKAFKRDFELIGIGLGAPSANFFKGTIENPSNFSWGNVDVVTLIHKHYALPVVITNDANVAAIGEMKFGVAQNFSNFIEITLGTGLGSGIVVNGNLVYGHDGFAGEIGHTILHENGRHCSCGRKGCLETYVSANGIRRTVFELLSTYNYNSTLRKISFQALTSKDIYEAALEGDKIANLAFETTGADLGLALSNSVAHLNPEAIVIFGGLALSGDLILRPTRDNLERNLLPLYKGKVQLLASGLMESENAAILGAAAIIWDEINKKKQNFKASKKIHSENYVSLD